MNNNPQPSISIDKAAAMLAITPEELTSFCDQDTGQRFHHRTIYTDKIRFFEPDIKKIRKHLTQTIKESINHPPMAPKNDYQKHTSPRQTI